MSEEVEAASKVVQTEVSPALYERLVRAATAREMTLKEAVCEAIDEFATRHEPIDPDDPVFEPLSSGTEGMPADDDASERVDHIAYGDGT